jgi:hypothetical protein
MARAKSERHQGVASTPLGGEGNTDCTSLSRFSLLTLADVRREVAAVFRQAQRGRISTQDATRLAYVLQVLAKVIESSSIESRLDALEALSHEAPR